MYGTGNFHFGMKGFGPSNVRRTASMPGTQISAQKVMTKHNLKYLKVKQGFGALLSLFGPFLVCFWRARVKHESRDV